MKVKIIYFAYLVPQLWQPIVIEQLDALYNINLYNIASEIYMSVISDDNELIKLRELINNKYNKIKLVNIYNENLYEYPGIKTLLEVAHKKFNNEDNKYDNEDNEDTIILYFHSKGIISNAHNYRKILFKYIIENYNEYLDEFKKNNNLTVASLFPHEDGFAFFNFFWVRASYLKNHDVNINSDRYYYESWVGNRNIKDKTVLTYSPLLKYETIKESEQQNGLNRADDLLLDIEKNIYNLDKPLKIYESFENANEIWYIIINIISCIVVTYLLYSMIKKRPNPRLMILICILCVCTSYNIIYKLFLEKFSNIKSIDNFSNSDNKYVCMYAYYEKNDEYKENFIYFLNNGLLDNVDYYIIINGDYTVNIPERDNIKIIKRENKGYDFGAWSHCINNYINKEYEYYIFINTSVRGPYIKKEDKINWLEKFLLLFNTDDIKMVGTTINILKQCDNDEVNYFTNYYKLIYNEKEPYTHIQSMFFILNNEGFNYILNQNFFNEELLNSYEDIQYVIFYNEIRLSQFILKNNWNINSIVPIYKNIDYRSHNDFINSDKPFTNEELIFYKNWNNK